MSRPIEQFSSDDEEVQMQQPRKSLKTKQAVQLDAVKHQVLNECLVYCKDQIQAMTANNIGSALRQETGNFGR